MPPSVDFFKKYFNRHFVETGSWHGDGVWCARHAGFDSVRSIELSPSLFQQCVNRFKDDNRVKLYQGDSGASLGSVIADINEPITFWLDAHYSEGDTAKGPCMTPLLQELEAIAKHHVKGHVILIDDHRNFSTDMFGGVTEDQVKAAIRKIDPCYQFEVVGDILVAKVGLDPLTVLADKYGTDKGLYGAYDQPLGHRFSMIYHELFKDEREKFKTVLEIGVDQGGSLMMWRDYFPNAYVWGADIVPMDFKEYGIEILCVDQGDESDLIAIEESTGKGLDLIVEDGSHQNDHQQQTFAALFGLLKEGGTYVIEDVHCGRLGHGGEGPNTLEVFQRYLECGVIDTPYLTREQSLYLERTIESCEIYNVPGTGVPGGSEIIVFTKKQPKILLVGNGPSLLGSSLGKKIDEFDVVVRMNKFRLKGFEKDVGTKTTVWWRTDCNDLLDPEVSFENVMLSILPRAEKAWATELQQKYAGKTVVVPERIHRGVHRDMGLGDPLTSDMWPSTGLIAISYFALLYGEVTICGFEGFAGKKHYWEPEVAPHLKFHDAVKEQKYVRDAIQLGAVKVL